jgi:uncharacterized repeat protein (TIGR03803 family)
MHSVGTNGKTQGRLNISDIAPGFGSTKRVTAAIRGALTLAVLSALLLNPARPAHAQTETVLYNFTGGSHGSHPNSGLTADSKGNFFGTTADGGLGAGTVFEISPNGTGGWKETLLYSFCSALSCVDGANPMIPNLVLDRAGNLYGTTYGGGDDQIGVVFELSPVGKRWKETVLYSFPGGANGYEPANGLIMDKSGNLYGTTGGGIFELSPSGGVWTEQMIYTAASSYWSWLTMDGSGNIFGVGTTTIFELSLNGKGGWNSTVLRTFKQGLFPEGTPALDQAGNLYGTTADGGLTSNGTVYKLSPGGKNGTWTEKILYTFNGVDGSNPAGVVLDASGNIYGTIARSGGSSAGSVYELVAPVGKGAYKEKILWAFNGTDGNGPSPVVLDGASKLYGTTAAGGSKSDGLVFEVTP